METTTEYEVAAWVMEAVKDWVDNHPEDTKEDVLSELFTSELNYNNCDKTSGQTVFTMDDLESEVDCALAQLREDEDRCSSCGKLITEDEYVDEPNLCTSDPYPIYENIVTGYKCDSCGHVEDY